MGVVQDILDHKGSHVVSIAEEADVLTAARLMNEQRIGALVVTRGDKVVGIFTERDLLNRVVAAQRDPAATPVAAVMSSPVACCAPQTLQDECRSVMRTRRLRHLPVVDEGRLVGLISIGDLNKAVQLEQEETIQFLYEYMHGEWR